MFRLSFETTKKFLPNPPQGDKHFYTMAISRTYRYTDARLMELAGVIHVHLSTHEAHMRQFNPKITADWLAALIEDAGQHSMDAFDRGKVSPRTKQYYEAAKYCQKQLTHFRFYIEQAADDDNEVGVAAALLPSYRAQRGRKSSFMLWMGTFALQLKECRAGLEEAGAPAVLIDRFLARVEVLQQAGDEQEQMKRRRTQKARDRVKAKNRLYDALRQVQRLAAIAYEQEDGSIQDEYSLFKLPAYRRKTKAQGQKEGVGEQVVSVSVSAEEQAATLSTTGQVDNTIAQEQVGPANTEQREAAPEHNKQQRETGG